MLRVYMSKFWRASNDGGLYYSGPVYMRVLCGLESFFGILCSVENKSVRDLK